MRIRITGSFLLTLLIVALVYSCYYDSEEYLYPQLNNGCDTINITFNLSVKPVLQNNCYGCHSNSTSTFGGNIRLEDYSDVLLSANNGKLLGSITHAGGFVPMPQGAQQLEACKITIIRKWIESGTPNN